MGSIVDTFKVKATTVFNKLTGEHYHPLNPLTAAEINKAVSIVRAVKGQLGYNAVTICEPKKTEVVAWLADPENAPKPARVADVVAIDKAGGIYDGIVDLDAEKLLSWEKAEGVQPLVCHEIKSPI